MNLGETETRISTILNESRIENETAEHDPVYTNPDMADKIGVPVGDTLQNLMLRSDKGETILLLLPGDKRFDGKTVAKSVGARVSFEKPERVLEIAGCEVGCVPPFGHLQPVRIFMDGDLLKKDAIWFNPGVHNKSVMISVDDLRELCNPIII